MLRRNNSEYTYIFSLKRTDKDYDLLQDRSVLSTGRTFCVKQIHNCLHYSRNPDLSPGQAQHQDGLTVSFKVTLTLIPNVKTTILSASISKTILHCFLIRDFIYSLFFPR